MLVGDRRMQSRIEGRGYWGGLARLVGFACMLIIELSLFPSNLVPEVVLNNDKTESDSNKHVQEYPRTSLSTFM